MSAAADADADFAIQGEYLSHDLRLGVQVVAKGSGTFTAVFLTGGLPGDGWNGSGRTELGGTLQGGQAVFTGNEYSATIAAGGDTLRATPKGGAPMSLPKVMRKSPTLDASPPPGAVVLFDGTGLSAWADGTATMTAEHWLLPQGVSESQGAVTKRKFQGFSLHLEFREPFMPSRSGQQRGNSGVYLQGRQELQILDSFGLSLVQTPQDTLTATGQCGSFFQVSPPLLNMCYPPLSWQTYDVEYTAAKYDGQALVAAARCTVRQNGVVIHSNRMLNYHTLLGDDIGPNPGPLRFQSHGDPVYYRNIWLKEKSETAVRPGAHSSLPSSGPRIDRTRADGRRLPRMDRKTQRPHFRYPTL